MWNVIKTYYMTYAEVAATGLPAEQCCPPELAAHRLSFETARAMVERLGFGYSMHPCAS